MRIPGREKATLLISRMVLEPVLRLRGWRGSSAASRAEAAPDIDRQGMEGLDSHIGNALLVLRTAQNGL